MKITDIIRRAVNDAPNFDWMNVVIDVSSEVFAAYLNESEVPLLSDGSDGLSRKALLALGPEDFTCEVWERADLEIENAAIACQGVDTWDGSLFRSAHERLAFLANV